jgi:hypothetical protein
MKRIMAIFMVLAFMFITVSCTGQKSTVQNSESDNNTQTETDTATETRIEPDIPADTNLDGASFVIDTVDYRGTVYSALYNPFAVEEETGDVTNDDTFRAINNIREKLNVKLVYIYHTNPTDASNIAKLSQAGDTSVDCVNVIDRFGAAMVGNDMVVSYEDIPYVDLSKPWWYDEINKQITLAGHLSFAVGAMNMDNTGSMQTLCFNKRILSDYNLDSPYDLVRNGEWTIDKFYSLMVPVIKDVNGDGNMDENDQWGACYTHDVFYNNFGPVSGEDMVKKDDSDMPYLAVLGNDKLIGIWQKLLEYKNQGLEYCVDVYGQTQYKSVSSNVYEEAMMMFKDGRALFGSVASLANYALYRDMDDDFGILPFPTSDEKKPGEGYYSYRNGICCAYFVPNSGLDLEKIGIVFESLCYEYYYNIIPDYLDTVAYTKQLRDEDSLEMLNMMNEKRVIDLACGYWWESTYASFYSIFRSGKDTFISNYTKLEKGINKTMTKTADAFLKAYGKDK